MTFVNLIVRVSFVQYVNVDYSTEANWKVCIDRSYRKSFARELRVVRIYNSRPRPRSNRVIKETENNI